MKRERLPVNDLEANKVVARAFLAALGGADKAMVGAVLHPDCRAIATGTCALSGERNRDAVLSTVDMLSEATRGGIAFSIISITAEEDRVSVEVEGKSILTSGKPYNNQYHFLFYVRGGKITRLKEYFCTKLAEEALLAGIS
jgi:ketosteroid isomerase-like protein